MKKQQFLITVFILVLCYPLIASADRIGTGDLKIGYGYPAIGNYYGDYDIIDSKNLSGIKLDSAEVFCISNDDLIKDTFSKFIFYSAEDIFVDYDVNFITWVANKSYNGSNPDKVEGQGAIWSELGVSPSNANNDYQNSISGSHTYYDNLYTTATDKGDYVDEWLVALNPDVDYLSSGNKGNQDFLVKASPTPEPTAMILFGTGLAGLAGLRSRRKR